MDAFLPPPKRVEVTISYTAQIRIKKNGVQVIRSARPWRISRSPRPGPRVFRTTRLQSGQAWPDAIERESRDR